MSKNPTPQYKNNSCKYNLVREKLLKCLEDGKSSRECAVDLRISIPTINRYKCCLSAELGKPFIVPEEKQFVERQKNKAAYYKKAAEAHAAEKNQDAPAETPSPKKGKKK
jgi:hypothetical protein